MANNVRVQEALSHALKACPTGPGVLAELCTAVELAARKARSNRGLAGARAEIKEALRLLKRAELDEDAATSVRSALRDALAYMEGRGGKDAGEEPEAEAPVEEATEPERPRRRRPAGGGRRSRRMPAEQASEASPIEAVLERSADGTTTIRVALRPGDLRALVREVLG